ncbi:Uncharacterised protein [Mycobacteroides abscessus subsp. abscessus]|nr:Uncharacterised protein [Mycobacteroides abscessus subsp. abscessus]SHX59497.1 Uncharacterised protein [Mycobacteroides abscessus subsp. abscessus]SIC05417.1 Uncharacterised protein [Mycobacteroides abscessus subsp. abscessus]SKV96692.1 Uncharacterised protein [Mycobacteroides abscessus subsp. abscessus]
MVSLGFGLYERKCTQICVIRPTHELEEYLESH